MNVWWWSSDSVTANAKNIVSRGHIASGACGGAVHFAPGTRPGEVIESREARIRVCGRNGRACRAKVSETTRATCASLLFLLFSITNKLAR